jgi:xanthine dehydrogenase accessory factor
MRLDLLCELNAERAARRPIVVVTSLASGAQRLVRAADVAADPLAAPLVEHLAAGRSGTVTANGETVLLTVCVPPPRLVLTGAVHVAQSLAPLARMVGYEVVIIDPRDTFASAARFPDQILIRAWPERVLGSVGLDRYTAAVALAHDPRIDDPLLRAALEYGCFFIGALGSRKTHAQRVERLCGQGLSAALIDRIRAPVGLPIGAATPQEIALAIMSQITAELRLPSDAPVSGLLQLA